MAVATLDRLRLMAVATHPIQYHAPWFRALAAREDLDLEVVFESVPDADAQGEGFGQPFRWDIPLRDGYRSRVLGDPEQRGGQVARRVRRLTAALSGLRRALREQRPQAVLLTGWQSPLLALAPWLAHRAGARVLVRGESNLLRPRPAWKHGLHRVGLRRYDGFLAIGRRNREFYAAAGVDDSRITDCPYFVDNQRFRRAARELDRREQRRRFGVPEDALCILFAGKLEAKKRPLDAVAALQQAGVRNAHLLVVGSGILDPAMRQAAEGLSVSFAGFLNQSEMPAAYAAADCLVLPSDHGETWGLVVNEAMACGLPAIVSDQVGCADDLVREGRTGWVHPTGDVAALARCFAAAAAAGEGLRAMGEAAERRVCERFTVERATEAVLTAARAASGARGRAAMSV